MIYVENNAYQQALIDWTQTKGFDTIPIIAFTTGKQKSDAEIGLPALDVQFERHLWRFYIPKHEVGCRCTWCQFVREMKNYPVYDTSDFVMSFWFAERALSKYHSSGNAFKEQKQTSNMLKIVKMNF